MENTTTSPESTGPRTTALATFLVLASASLVVYELLLTRLFSLVIFAHLANFAIGLALLGIGFGATCMHVFPRLVPADRLGSRLGWIAIIQALSIVGAVVVLLAVPLNEQWSDNFRGIMAWNMQARSLVKPGNLAAIAPVLMLPFFFGGLGFSAVFKFGREHIGGLYAADLWGGALGGALFIPLLSVVAGPDTAFVAAALAALAAIPTLWSTGKRDGAAVGILVLAACLAATVVSMTGRELLKVRFTAGFSEADIVYSEWTPVARVSIHKNRWRHRDEIVLDTTSSSEVIQTAARRQRMVAAADRSLPFRLVDKRLPVAIIAAAAGNEVAVAQALGFEDITAIDIVGTYHRILQQKYAKVPVNPYLQKGVRFLEMDGRAGIVHSGRKYGVILMRWANLHNAAGLISNAWSPSLLETRNAFSDYLRHLDKDGIIAFSKGSDTALMVKSVASALKRRGMRRPMRGIAEIQGSDGTLLLVRPRQWTPPETRQMRAMVKSLGGRMLIDPYRKLRPGILRDSRVMTDDRPYRDRPADFFNGLKLLLGQKVPGVSGRVNMMLWVQAAALGIAGLLFVGLPFAVRSRREIAHVRGKGSPLTYAAAIGFGYLAIETVLIHELVLFVGHPTYAITLVVLVMLLGSGLGSMRIGKLPAEGLARRLLIALAAVMALSLLQALVMPRFYDAVLVGSSIWVRCAVVGVSLLPLAYFMGMPFPLALRVMPPAGGELVPWMWALNGWMSVVATMSTVFLSRQLGFRASLVAGVLAYAIALLASRRLSAVQELVPAPLPAAPASAPEPEPTPTPPAEPPPSEPPPASEPPPQAA